MTPMSLILFKASIAMDKQERKLLIAKFPMQLRDWSLEFSVDKLTDAQSVLAKTTVQGAQAGYGLQLRCLPGTRSIEIDAFDKASAPKPIFSDFPSRQMRIRADDYPPVVITLNQSG